MQGRQRAQSPTSARLKELQRRVNALQTEIDSSTTREPSRRGSTVEDHSSASWSSCNRSATRIARRPTGGRDEEGVSRTTIHPSLGASPSSGWARQPTKNPEVHDEQSTPHTSPQAEATSHSHLDGSHNAPERIHGDGNSWSPSPLPDTADATEEVLRLRQENDRYRALLRESTDRIDGLERELRRSRRRSLDQQSQDHSSGSTMNLEARVMEMEEIIRKQDKELRRMSELMTSNMRTSRGELPSVEDLRAQVQVLKGELSSAKVRADDAEERAGQWALLEKSISRVLARLTACVGGGLVAITPRKQQRHQGELEYAYICVSLTDINVFAEPDEPEPILSFSKDSMKVAIVVSDDDDDRSPACHSQLKLFRCSHACGQPEVVMRCRNARETEKWIRLFKAVGVGVDLVGSPPFSSGPSSRPSTPVSTRAFRTRQKLWQRKRHSIFN